MYWKGSFVVETGAVVVNQLILSRKSSCFVEWLGGQKAVDGQAKGLADQMLANDFELECGETIRGTCFLVLYFMTA